MNREKIGYLLILLFAVISISAIVGRMITGDRGEVGRLGIVGGGYKPPCTGKLEVTYNKIDEKCSLQADVEMGNCEGRWYVFKGNECGGTLVCNGEIMTQTDRWRCSWEDNTGTHTFTLCENIDKKDFATVTC